MSGFKNDEPSLPDYTTTTEPVVPVNTECAICLEDPIPSKPVVLPKCRHAFCFSRLQDWQSYRIFDPTVDYIAVSSGDMDKTNKTRCPYCRQDVYKSVTE